MTMRLARPSATPFDWRRVGAFSTSVAAHLAAFALLLIPLAPPVRQAVQRAIEVSWIEAPPPLPELPLPKEMEPPPKPRRPVVTTPVPPPRPQPAPPVAAESPAMPTASAPVEPTAPTGSDAATDAPVQVPGGETRQLAYDGTLHARYPAPSIRAREEGTVLLRVLVDAEGRVERVEIARSSGHPKLDAAARDAVRNGRFKPVLIAGKATPAWGLVPIEFRLDRG